MNDPLAYKMAQSAIAELKSSIYLLLSSCDDNGLSNAEIGRALGIYHGHIGHEGHIPRTLLAIMEHEGAVEQNAETKRWLLK